MENLLKTEPPPHINLQRAIYINCAIDEPLTARLTAEVLRLRAESADSITLFMDSFGGSTDSLGYILDLLRAESGEQHDCKIITVVIGHASSAAAVLLVNGDHAIAYPGATIHFHGVRVSEAQNLTVEEAHRYSRQLRRINRDNALDLSRFVARRMIRRFAEFLKEPGRPSANSQIDEFFLSYLPGKVSNTTRHLFEEAAVRTLDSIRLLQRTLKALARRQQPGRSLAQEQAAILREVIQHRAAKLTRPDDEINGEVLDDIVEDYLMIRNYHRGKFDAYLKSLAPDFCTAFLDYDDMADFAKDFPGQKLNPGHLTDEQLVWLFPRMRRNKFSVFLAHVIFLCQRLQRDENSLSAQDAYWLGVVDEVWQQNTKKN